MPHLNNAVISKSFLPSISEKRPSSIVKPAKKPEKTTKLPKLFALAQTNQVRDELDRLKQEKTEYNEYNTIIAKLPRINSELQTKIDYFSAFFEEPLIEELPFTFDSRLTRFLEFCEAHKQIEIERKLYYSFYGRCRIKYKQIDTIRKENCSFEEGLAIVLRICALDEKDKINGEILQQRFQKVMSEFAVKSFELCSLKSCSTYHEVIIEVAHKLRQLLEEKKLAEEYDCWRWMERINLIRVQAKKCGQNKNFYKKFYKILV